jgi:hypothetical protein
VMRGFDLEQAMRFDRCNGFRRHEERFIHSHLCHSSSFSLLPASPSLSPSTPTLSNKCLPSHILPFVNMTTRDGLFTQNRMSPLLLAVQSSQGVEMKIWFLCSAREWRKHERILENMRKMNEEWLCGVRNVRVE